MSATLSMDARLAAERELFAQLDIAQLEELAAESQALVDRAAAVVRAQGVRPASATLLGAAVTEDTTSDAITETCADTRRGVHDVSAGQPPKAFEVPTSAAAARPTLGGAESADSADSTDEPAATRSGTGSGDQGL